MDIGFQVGKASPCSFHHAKIELSTSVHGDDFTIVGPSESLRWLEQQMTRRYEIKCEMLWPKDEEGCKTEIRILNRTLSWRQGGVQYEPDQRHAEMIIQAVVRLYADRACGEGRSRGGGNEGGNE